MKKVGTLLAAVALCAMIAPQIGAEEEAAWFDPHNCGICKNFTKEEGLMEAVEWEAHVIANGMLSVASVPAEFEEAFARAHKGIEETVKRMQGGEPTKMCGFCMSYGALMMAGAKVEQIQTKAGHIGLVTSDNPEVVAKIHAHAKRTIAEAENWDAIVKGS